MRILETSRLWLRTWDVTDLDLGLQLWGDPEVMAFLGGPLSKEKVENKLKAEIACMEEHRVQYWPVFEKKSDDFVGCCGLRPWTYAPPGGHEMGFHLVRAKWNRGYGNEAAQGIVTHAFEQLALPVLRTGHHPDNIGSRKILMNLGFQFVQDVFYKPTGLMHPTYELRAKI